MASSSSSSLEKYPYPLHVDVGLRVPVKLSTGNYDVWRSYMVGLIEEQGLMGFLNGTIKAPPEKITVPDDSSTGTKEMGNEDYNKWKKTDQLLQGWIIQRLNEDFLVHVHHLKTAKEVWAMLERNFGYQAPPGFNARLCKQFDNSRQSLSTHSIIPAIKERCVSIFIDMAKDAETSKPKHLDPTSEYYLSSQANSGNSLTKDTLKGDNYVAREQSAFLTLKSHNKLAFIDGRITKPDPESEDFLAWDIVNSTLYLQTCQFLMDLDDKYATLRTQIINIDPFPNIDRVYAMVMQEESHRGITGSRATTSAVGFHAQNRPPTAQSSSLVSATAEDPDRTPTGQPWCTFCHRIGHTQEKCYRRLGIALPGKGRGRGRGSPAMSQNAVGSSSGPLQASASATHNNNPSLSQAQAVATFALPGLTPEQMQCLITFLESSPSGTDSLDIPPSPVGLPDGLQTNAIKAGSVSLVDGITLRHVLYVPNLAVNLISVSCLATDANCFVAFSHDICVLQDRTSKSPIGLSKMHRGVFVFQPLFTAAVAAVSESESYELWHRRMGHPSN
ncbi:hypothetical protein RJ639_029967 [Escallonia herrerae]|uniref:Retrotransposon Copia-like N-terminal domain-containing protein n=1 Tax=Escallonia herrerae TaxID=1293975 RepID=A0AA88X155_9ASTE|nr:hypothetical protein RJ639_029967 [Escallonia herrerae]